MFRSCESHGDLITPNDDEEEEEEEEEGGGGISPGEAGDRGSGHRGEMRHTVWSLSICQTLRQRGGRIHSHLH